MEQEKFHLKDHIMEIDKVMGIPQCAALLKYVSYKDTQGAFNTATIINAGKGKEGENTKIRNTKNFSLTNLNESITDQHWCNLVHNIFTQACHDIKKLCIPTSINSVYDNYLNMNQVVIT